MATGIDFMAIARGREAALADNYKDITRLQQQEQYRFARESQLEQERTRQINRQAVSYLSPWMVNMQRLTEGGQNDEVDAYLQNRQMVVNDPNFQSFAPEVQQKVLEQLDTFAVPLAQRLVSAEDIAGLNKLTAGRGITSPISAITAATQSGDANQIIAAAGLTPNADGTTVTYLGENIPISLAALRIAQAKGAEGILTATEEQRQGGLAQSAAEQLRTQQVADRNSSVEAALIGAGWAKLPDGSLQNPVTPTQVYKMNEQGILAPGALPSVAPIAGALPATVATGFAGDTTAATAAAPTVAGAAPPTAVSALDAGGLQQSLSTLSNNTVQWQEQLKTLQAQRQSVQTALDQLPPARNLAVGEQLGPSRIVTPEQAPLLERLNTLNAQEQTLTANLRQAVPQFQALQGQFNLQAIGARGSSVQQIVQEQTNAAIQTGQSQQSAEALVRGRDGLRNMLLNGIRARLATLQPGTPEYLQAQTAFTNFGGR